LVHEGSPLDLQVAFNFHAGDRNVERFLFKHIFISYQNAVCTKPKQTTFSIRSEYATTNVGRLLLNDAITNIAGEDKN
jgi:hypothetical protein